MYYRLHDLIARGARERGDRPALTYGDTTLSYAELWQEVRRAAAAFGRLGLKRGDRVAIYLEKRVETVVAIFGAAAAGLVFVPVNPLLRPKQVGHILSDCGVTLLVTSPDRHKLLRGELEQGKSVEQIIMVGGESEVGLPWPEFLAGAGSYAELPAVDVDMVAILYTSGSTGLPKGIVLSHRNLLAGATSVAEYLGNDADDVILAALPLSFDAGFSQLTTGFAAGAHVVLVNYLLAGDVVKLCAKHRVTGLTCVPPLWIQLADQTWPDEASRHLRYFANTGGRMPQTTLKRLRAIFPAAKPYLMYGLTESFRSTYLDPAEVDRRPGSIGKAIPNAEVLVVRPDGSICDADEPGELVHRGALVALGYWNDPERTAERFKPAPGQPAGVTTTELAVWSGDIVVRDADGFLSFVGRNDEMIKTSGYRVSPTEIEEVVYETGLVRDAVALGVEDPDLGQHVVLIVTPSGPELDPKALLGTLKGQLPRYMVPKHVHVRPEIPRSPNGKFDRNLLRQELSDT